MIYDIVQKLYTRWRERGIKYTMHASKSLKKNPQCNTFLSLNAIGKSSLSLGSSIWTQDRHHDSILHHPGERPRFVLPFDIHVNRSIQHDAQGILGGEIGGSEPPVPADDVVGQTDLETAFFIGSGFDGQEEEWVVPEFRW